jgi:hypothetical protein
MKTAVQNPWAKSRIGLPIQRTTSTPEDFSYEMHQAYRSGKLGKKLPGKIPYSSEAQATNRVRERQKMQVFQKNPAETATLNTLGLV